MGVIPAIAVAGVGCPRAEMVIMAAGVMMAAVMMAEEEGMAGAVDIDLGMILTAN
jgi:hypothetical protein